MQSTSLLVDVVSDPLLLCRFLLGCFGLCFIVGHSKVSLPFRLVLAGSPAAPAVVDRGVELIPAVQARAPLVPGLGPFLVDLVECPACFSFWLGVVWGELTDGRVGPALALGLVASGSSFILARLTNLTGET